MISAAVWIIVKASVLLGLAAAVQGVMHRRTSAAMRHLVWTLALVGVLALPLLVLVLPEWPVVVRSAPPARADAGTFFARVEESVAPTGLAALPAEPAESTSSSGSATTTASPLAIAVLYAAGVLAMLTYLTLQRRRVRRLAREATDVQDKEWTRLLGECATRQRVHRPVVLRRSRECSMPMAVGTFRPVIVIPAIADTWSEDRRRAVLLHELAHVARHDCLTQSFAVAACTMYWFHPAAWWVAHRLRIERELASDDRVIIAGAPRQDYASHLLEIAYSLGSHRAPALAVAMARPRQLEGRMLAVLDVARNRRVPSRRVRMAAAAICTLVLLPVAGATSTTVAAERDVRRASASFNVMPSSEQEGSIDPYSRAWSWIHSVRLVRAATELIGIAQNALPGTWEIRPTTTQGVVHLRLTEWNSSSGTNIAIDRLDGLTAGQLSGAGGPVQFRLRRDAGTFTFEGVFRNGVGAGTFSFAADSAFPGELAKRGFTRPTALEQYQLARHDIGYAFIDELNKQGYGRAQTSDLVRAGQHGVHVEYLRDMGGLGYRLGTLDPLIELRDHGVTPSYVRELSANGYKGLSADGLRQARDHGVTPDYVRAMRDGGYSVPMEQLINARDHGISAEYVREFGELGYRTVPLDQLIRVRDHGVDVEFVRGMRSLGYPDLSLDALVRLRDHGVTPRYVEELKSLGYDGLLVDDLVMLRDYGLTADRIGAANKRAGTRLPVDLLKRLASGGID